MDDLEHNDEEQTTVNDQKMADYLTNTESQPYGFTYMKQQIQSHFGNRIIS